MSDRSRIVVDLDRSLATGLRIFSVTTGKPIREIISDLIEKHLNDQEKEKAA